MKVNAITNFKMRFRGADNNQQPVQIPQQNESGSKQELPKINTQPLAGLIAPDKPIPKSPITPPPVGGLIAVPPMPKLPVPTTTRPIGGLITPPVLPIPVPPEAPKTTAGVIMPPQKESKEEPKTEEKQ